MAGGLQLAGRYDFGNHFGHVGSNHVGAQQLAVFGVVDDLHKTVLGTGGAGFSARREREFAHLDVKTGFLGLLLRVAHARDFGRTVGATGDVVVVQGLGVVSGDFFHAGDAFRRSHVGKRLALDYVANGEVAGDVGGVVVVGHNNAALGLDAHGLQANVLDVGGHAHGRQHHVAFDFVLALGVLVGHHASGALGVHVGHLGSGFNGDAVFLEGALQLLRNVFVLVGHNAGQVLHHGHLGAHGAVHVCELHADGARPHNDHGLGLLGQGHGLAVPNDFYAVLLQSGQFAGPTAGGNQDVFTAVGGFLAVVSLDHHLFARGHFAVALDNGDVVLFHQKLDAFAHSTGHIAAALNDLAKVVRGFFDLDAVIGSVLDVFKYLGAFD